MPLRLYARLLVAAILPALAAAGHPQNPVPAHTIASFQFTVAAAFAQVAPQFGPQAERAWGDPTWNPHFIYPQPDKDIPGAVFTVPRGHKSSIWVNTNYDPVSGRMQYVYFVQNIMVCVIDVHVTPIDPTHTTVDVTYTRTALAAKHNQTIAHLSHQDKQSGPEWQHSIEHALGMNHP